MPNQSRSTTPTPVTVGIPYRDEGQDFALLAGGLSQALDALPVEIAREVVFCVNGSPEGFARYLEMLAKESPLGHHGVRVITSAEGKLTAQQAIVDARSLAGYLAFVDSDVVLESNALRCLWEILESDSDCMVSYGQPVAVFPENFNWVHLLLRTHYSLRERAYCRVYFHGRAFMVRRWFLEPPTSAQAQHSASAKRLQLHRGPLVDDIVLSRIAVATWGPESIREVQEANVYFDPPDTLRGLYAAHLRVALELQRLDLLYPGHSHLQERVFTANWRPEAIQRFSRRLRLLHACYRLLEGSLRRAARIHVALVKAGLLNLDTLWVCIPGTKNFARHRNSWRSFRSDACRPKPPEKS
ncbi:MAG: glycosyltransferase [Bryobacteraceae bacterium]